MLSISGTVSSLIEMQVGSGNRAYIYSDATKAEIYSYTKLDLSTNGAERISIQANGNVLIGTTTDAGYKLRVNGNTYIDGTTGMYGQLYFTNMYAIGNPFDFIKSTYNGGIYCGIKFTAYNPNNDLGSALGLQVMDGAGNYVQPLYLSGANGYVGVGTTSPNRKLTIEGTSNAYMSFNATSNRNTTIGSDGVGNFIVFDDTFGDYRMAIFSDGNLAINRSTNAGYKLDVNGQAAIGSGAQAIVGTDGTYAGYSTIGFGGTTNGYNRVFGNTGTGDGLYLAAATSQGIWFWTNGANTRMHISPGGNVIIGSTTDAGFKLDVNGTARVSSYLNVNAQADAANGSINIESIDPTLRFRVTSGTANKRIYEWRAIAAGGAYDYLQLRLWNDAQTSASQLLSISSDGAATFSSSVSVDTTMSALNIRARSGGSLFLANPSNTYDWALFHNASNNLIFNFNGSNLLTLNTGGAATFSSTINATSFTAGNRTVLTSAAIYDNYSGNSMGIAFGSGVLISTEGAGNYSAQNLGNATYPWYSANFVSTITASQGLFTSGSSLAGVIVKGSSSNQGVLQFGDANTNFQIQGGVDYSGMLFKVGSVERMRIVLSSGNVLINTTTDAGYKLNVNGTTKLNGSVEISASNTYFGAVKGYTYIVDDQINCYYSYNGEATLNFNYYGYNQGLTQFRNFKVFNGKGSEIFGLSGVTGAATFSSSVTATNFIVPGGTSAQFLKADGSLDSNVYLTSTSSTFSYTSSVTLTTSFQNTGVSSANLGTGVYLVSCYANDWAVGGQYNCTYTGVMYFYAGGTNSSNTNEIVLHHSGHADEGKYIYLRTLSTVSADGKTYLQISSNGTNSGASNYQFTFKKLL